MGSPIPVGVDMFTPAGLGQTEQVLGQTGQGSGQTEQGLGQTGQGLGQTLDVSRRYSVQKDNDP